MESIFYNRGFDIWPLGLVLLIIPIAILLYKKRNFYHIFFVSVFGVYLLYVAHKVFFPLQIDGNYAETMREQASFADSINLIPFYFGRFGTLESSLETLLLNILLTIPFGFGINFIAQVKGRDFLWLAPALGFGLEMAQLVISLLIRYPYRIIDINDVLMNGLGVLIGYGIFRVFAWAYLWASKRFEIEHVGLGSYIYELIKLRIGKSSHL